MSWNHRVMRTTEPEGAHHFAIHEVYYSENGSIKAWTERAVGPCGDTLKELQQDVSRFTLAFTRPILDVRGGDLFEIGLTGRTRHAPKCVFRSSESQSVDPQPQTEKE